MVEVERAQYARRRRSPTAAPRLTVRHWRLSVGEQVTYVAACVYAAVFSTFAVLHHLAFGTQRYDLGIMTQAIWNTLHGHFLEVTTQQSEQVTHFAVHVDPFLALLVPLFWIWPSAVMLLILQAVAVALGALPVFWLARKHLRTERAGIFFAVAYLLFPATQFNALAVATDSGFHPISVAMPLLLFAIWFLDQGRLVAFAIVGVLAATTKEEMPLVIGLLCLWYACRHGRWRFGLAVLAAGLTLTLVDFLVVIPHYLGSSTQFGGWYTNVGGTPIGVLRTSITDPLVILRDVATGHKLVYLLLLLGPFLGLCFREPLLLLAAAPDLAINLLSNQMGPTSIAYHYTAGIVPFVVAGSIFGLARLRSQIPRLSLYVLAFVMGVTLYSPIWVGAKGLSEAFPSSDVHRAKAHALGLVPAGVPVSASNQLGAHLSSRRRIMIFPFAIAEAHWVVVDQADPSVDGNALHKGITRLRHARSWRLVYSSRGIWVFHKPT